MTIWGLFNGKSGEMKQAQEMARQIATQKQQKVSSDKMVVAENIGKNRLPIIQEAFKESEKKGIEVFGKSSALELYSISQNPELRKSAIIYKEPIKNYLSKFPKIQQYYWIGSKANGADMVIQLKYVYFSEACALAETQEESERQTLAYSLQNIEKAFTSLEKGKIPENYFSIRSTKDGKVISDKFVIEQTQDGMYVIHRTAN